MSDYTPTTEEVEAGYAYNEWDTDAAEEAPRRDEFRRWLAQVKAEAWIEGYYACHQDYQRKSGPMLTPNPYRKEADQ